MADIENVILFVFCNSAWHPALHIPYGRLSKTSSVPLKWLQYLGYCLTGSMGSLPASPKESANVADHSFSGHESKIQEKYYYKPDGQ
jgi:hypothetical protein